MSVKNKINDMEGAYENNKEIKKNGCRSIGFAYGNVWDSKHPVSYTHLNQPE